MQILAEETLTNHKVFERLLRRRRLELQQEIIATFRRSDAERHVQIADCVCESEDRPLAALLAEVNKAEIKREVEELEDIEQALVRLNEHRYGVCIQCSALIPPERLFAHPTARRCISCQRAIEHAGH